MQVTPAHLAPLIAVLADPGASEAQVIGAAAALLETISVRGYGGDEDLEVRAWALT